MSRASDASANAWQRIPRAQDGVIGRQEADGAHALGDCFADTSHHQACAAHADRLGSEISESVRCARVLR